MFKVGILILGISTSTEAVCLSYICFRDFIIKISPERYPIFGISFAIMSILVGIFTISTLMGMSNGR